MAGGGVNYKLGADVGSFKQGMNEAQASLKTLDAALKVNEASFKAGGDAQVYMQQKTQLLTDKMTKQKTLVTQLQQGLKQMREQGVKPTSTEYQTLETKLLNAQTAMIETKSALDNLDESQQKTATSAGTLTDSVNSIGKKISLDAVISGINSITSAMESAAGKAISLGETIWSNVMNSAQWADDTQTMALMYGVDLDTFLRVQKIVESGLDTSVEAILKSQQKLKKNIGTGSDSFMQTLRELNLLNTSDSGKYGTVELIPEDTDELFWRAGKAIMNLGDTYEQEAKAQELFGKSWRELIPLFSEYDSLEDWNEALENTKAESEEEVSVLAQLADDVDGLKAKLTTLSHEVWATLAPALSKAAETLSGLLDKVLEYLETPEGQKALTDMEAAVSGLFEDLGKIDPEQVVNNFASVFGSVADSFTWLYEHKQDVVDALIDIAGTFALMKVTESVLTFLKLAQGLVGLNGDSGTQTTGNNIQTGPIQGPQQQPTNNTNQYGSGVEVVQGVTIGGAIGGVALGDYLDEFMEMRERKTMDEIREYMYEKYGVDEGGGGSHGFGIPKDVDDTIKDTAEELQEGLEKNLVNSAVDLSDAWNKFISEHNTHETADNYADTLEEALPELQQAWDDFFGNNPVETEMQPVVDENAAEDITEQVGTVEIPAVLMVTSAKSGPYTSLGSFSAGSPLVYYSKDLNEHANGIWNVPFDNYPAMLHKGERVVTAREANRSYNSNLYVEKMYMNNGTDAQGLANAMAAAQRRRMSGYGS